MSRTKAERRYQDWLHSLKKATIIKSVWKDHTWFDGTYKDQMHRLSKGKIHCSCPICSAKSNRNGYTVSDLKKFEALQSSVEEADVNLHISTPRRAW